MGGQEEKERRLLELLREYDPEIAAVWLGTSMSRRTEMESDADPSDLEDIKLAGIREDCCYRIKFRYPVLLLGSRGISLFRTLLPYYQKRPIGFQPVYLPALNMMTVLKTWGDFAERQLGPDAMMAPGYTCLKISRGEQEVTLSSLNFLLRQNTDFSEEDNTALVNVVRLYFEYLYWSLLRPTPRVSSLVFYHDFDSIRAVHDFSKTIFIITKLEGREELQLGQDVLKLIGARVKRLEIAEHGFALKDVFCYVPADVALDLKIGDHVIGLFDRLSVGPTRQGRPIIFAITGKVRDGKEMLKAAAGITAISRFDATQDTSLGWRKHFEKDVLALAGMFRESRAYDDIAKADHSKLFEDALDALHPAIIRDRDEGLHFFHPAFMGLLLHFEKTGLLERDSDALLDLLKLLKYRGMPARKSAEADRLASKGLDKSALLKCLPIIRNKIRYSQIHRTS